jgi:hypothetical protein
MNAHWLLLSGAIIFGGCFIYSGRKKWALILLWLFAIGIAILDITMFVGSAAAGSRRGLLPVLIVWAIIPPFFFWLEFTQVRPTLEGDALQRFRHSQDLSGRMWAAVLAILALLAQTALK